MQLEGTRFGDIDIDDGRVIEFAAGLIGFPAARRFVLLERNPSDPIAWLQSLDVPGLAFPVIEAGALGDDYPSPGATQLAQNAAAKSGLAPSLLRQMLPMLSMLISGYMARQPGAAAAKFASMLDWEGEGNPLDDILRGAGRSMHQSASTDGQPRSTR